MDYNVPANNSGNNQTPPDHKAKSSLTVLEKSRELHILLSKVTLDDNILSKAFRYNIGKPVTDHSQAVYESLAVANTIDLYDKDLTEERKSCQMHARRELTKLLASLRVLYSISGMDAAKMKLLLDKTIEVERLLKKWMESDRNRLGISLHVIKKDEIDTHIFDKQITAKDLFGTPVHVDFDTLLNDARNQEGITPKHHENKGVFIPPASTLAQPPAITPTYIIKTEEARRNDFLRSRFELDNVGRAGAAPEPKERHQDVVASKSIIRPTMLQEVVVLPSKPIIVPDDRIIPEPPPPSIEEQMKEPVPSNITLLKNATAEIATEEVEEEKSTVCNTPSTTSSVLSGVPTTVPEHPKETSVTTPTEGLTSTSVEEKNTAELPTNSSSTVTPSTT